MSIRKIYPGTVVVHKEYVWFCLGLERCLLYYVREKHWEIQFTDSMFDATHEFIE